MNLCKDILASKPVEPPAVTVKECELRALKNKLAATENAHAQCGGFDDLIARLKLDIAYCETHDNNFGSNCDVARQPV